MNRSDRFARVESLYHAARARTLAERAAFLEAACAGDVELRREVESLLAQPETGRGLLDMPAPGADGGVSSFGTLILTGRQFGPYEIRESIGAGGMGEVYRARDTTLGRDVAIKILPTIFSTDSDRRARFEREARVLAALNHPHIGAIYGVEESDGIRALVLELVDGETLAERIARGPISIGEALTIAQQITEAIDAAHEKGIVHRDLKPANIKITPHGIVKVLDFGLAKTAIGDGSGLDLTRSPTITSGGTRDGVLLGTAAYVSPEQARGKAIDKRTDIWAFGCVLYEMLTGRRLHQGDSVSETVAAVLKESPDLSGIPAHLRRLLRSCLQKDPQHRLHDLADWHFLVDDPDVVVPGSAMPNRRWLWAGAAAALVVAAAAIGMVLMRGPAPTSEEVRVLRLPIATPDGLTFNAGTQATMSPDGRWLAFAAVGPDKVSRMYLQSLSAPDVRPLRGSEGIVELSPPPFWSYDSRYVVYAAADRDTNASGPFRLKKSDVDGTPAQTIAEIGIPFAQGGSWSKGDTILYARNSGHLERVSVNGGTPVTVTALAPTELAHRWPQFLPDGRRFLYQRVSTTPGQTGIYVGSIEETPENQSLEMLVPTDRPARWTMSPVSGSAFLLIQREDALLAQPFDTATATLSGTAVVVASGVGSWGPATSGLWSVSDHGDLVYRGGGSGPLHLIFRDLKGNVLEDIGEPRPFEDVTLSPDGTRVAYRLTDAQRNADIYVYDLRQRTESRLTFDSGIAYAPVWSSDSKRVMFAARRHNARGDLYVKNADGSGEESVLYTSDRDKVPVSASKDGKLLLFSSSDAKTGEDLFLLRLDSRQASPLVDSTDQEGFGQISPDLKWIAYTVRTRGGIGITIKVRPVPGTGSGEWQIASGTQPRWGRDGKRLFYISPEGELTAVDVEPGPVWRASAPRGLFRGIVPIFPAVPWSLDPSGSKVLLAQPAPNTGPPSPFTLVLNWISKLQR